MQNSFVGLSYESRCLRVVHRGPDDKYWYTEDDYAVADDKEVLGTVRKAPWSAAVEGRRGSLGFLCAGGEESIKARWGRGREVGI